MRESGCRQAASWGLSLGGEEGSTFSFRLLTFYLIRLAFVGPARRSR